MTKASEPGQVRKEAAAAGVSGIGIRFSAIVFLILPLWAFAEAFSKPTFKN